MAVTRQKIRGKEMILVEGKVTGWYVNEIPADRRKTYSGKNGPWTPTHSYKLVVDGENISLGMGEKDGVSERQQIRVKDNDGNYHTIAKGLEVSVEVEEAGEYKDKMQYRSSTGKVVVLDATGVVAEAQNKPAGQGSYKPKDMTGVEVGHAINGAMNVIITFGGDASNENIVRYAGSVHNVTTKIKKLHAEANPDKSDYDVGSAVGNAVLNACKLVGLDAEFETSLEQIALDLLENVVVPVEKYVKEGRGAAKPARRTAAAPTRNTAKAAKKQKEPAEENVTEEVKSAPFDDMDDDIPF